MEGTRVRQLAITGQRFCALFRLEMRLNSLERAQSQRSLAVRASRLSGSHVWSHSNSDGVFIQESSEGAH